MKFPSVTGPVAFVAEAFASSAATVIVAEDDASAAVTLVVAPVSASLAQMGACLVIPRTAGLAIGTTRNASADHSASNTATPRTIVISRCSGPDLTRWDEGQNMPARFPPRMHLDIESLVRAARA